jgi:hypothetical protein
MTTRCESAAFMLEIAYIAKKTSMNRVRDVALSYAKIIGLALVHMSSVKNMLI